MSRKLRPYHNAIARDLELSGGVSTPEFRGETYVRIMVAIRSQKPSKQRRNAYMLGFLLKPHGDRDAPEVAGVVRFACA